MHGTGAPLGRFSREVPDVALEQARAVAAALEAAQTILVAGHAGADGDVVGSSLALAHAMRERGKTVTVYNPQPYPPAYAWLAGDIVVVAALPPQARFDVSVVVDAADPTRLGPHFPDARRRGVFVWIDHHRIAAPPGDVNFIDLTSAAVGEQVALVLDAMGHALSLDVARCVYASLLSDTGGFRYGNTSVRVFQLAARLVDAGVEPWRMTEAIYESQDEGRVRLLARALQSLWISPCGRLGVVEVTEDDLVAARALDEHVQGIVNHVRSIRGVEVAVLLRAFPEHVSATFRSRGNVAIAPIANSLGSEGQKNAATVPLRTSLREARDRVVESSLAHLPPLAAPVARMPSPRGETSGARMVRPRRRRAGPR